MNTTVFPLPRGYRLSNRSSQAAGVMMQVLAFSAPLLVGGGTKVTYDLLLYKLFRRLKPPEEALALVGGAGSNT
jgi:hypothetical protein